MKFLLLALGIFGVDYGFKDYTNSHRLQGEEEAILGGRMILRNYHNEGAALGFFKNYPKLNKGLSFFVLSGVIWEYLKKLAVRGEKLTKLGLCLLTGGGLNNCWERLRKGYVTDYISFRTSHKKLQKIVFNLSDVCIIAGTGLWLLSGLLPSHKNKTIKFRN